MDSRSIGADLSFAVPQAREPAVVTPEDVVIVRGAPGDDEPAALALPASRPRAAPAAGKAPAWVRESFTAPGSWARG